MEPLDRNINFNEELHPTFDPAAPPKYWFAHTVQQYARYRGRAGRFEYWNFQMWSVIWVAVSGVIWGGIRLTGNFDYCESPTFELANVLSAYASGLMVVALGAVMPDKTKRTALIVIGTLMLLWRIAEVLMWIWESF